MQIDELIKLIKKRKVSGITANSKLVSNNFIFVAVKGAQADGSKFIGSALARGAKFIICNASVKLKYSWPAQFVKVKDTRSSLARLAAYFYKNPSKQIKVIGITGTNGKTTITYLLEALLKEAGLSPAVIGTINYRFKNKIIPAKNTTPGPVEIQKLLAEMVKKGVDYLAMEVSSHALSQERVLGVNFHSAIFTNLTQDHLDYHKTFKNYFQAKAKLFKHLGPQAFAVINNDDKYSVRLKKITPAKIITYGIKNKADVTAQGIKSDLRHTEFNLCFHGKKIKFSTRLIGRHNIYNVLAASAWGIKAGLSLKAIQSAWEKFSSVPGRLERINSKKGFSVFIDYAHTDDALKNALHTLRQLSPRRIITLFGCGGERDKAKRPKMGKVVTSLSDFAVITSDNPRSENPADIARDIRRGISNHDYCVILERRKAIQKALALAKAGDIVLLAGKGHERYQVLKNKSIHFNDKEETRQCLASLNY